MSAQCKKKYGKYAPPPHLGSFAERALPATSTTRATFQPCNAEFRLSLGGGSEPTASISGVEIAAGYVRRLRDISKGAREAFPCQELVRAASNVRQPRNWPLRWMRVGGKLYPGDRMVALVEDPIWTKISRFGCPYPPFDYGSHMVLRSVSRREALELGAIEEDYEPEEIEAEDFNEGLSASFAPDLLASEEFGRLKEDFGDLVGYERNADGSVEVKWEGERLRNLAEGGSEKKVSLGTSNADAAFGTGALAVSNQFFHEHLEKHMEGNETDPRGVGLRSDEYELLPIVWKSPDRVETGDSETSRICELDAFDGGIYRLVVDTAQGNVLKSFHKAKGK